MRGRVIVRLRPEVLDPQGATVAKALDNLGYEGVGAVRQGKVFDIKLDTDDADEAREILARMGRELLANPVIEEFEVSLDVDDWARAVAVAGDRRSGAERRVVDDRRSGVDRRAAEPPDYTDDRRSGEDRRTEERRVIEDRRSGERRRLEDRRDGEDRRVDDSDYTGPEQRERERRIGPRRGEER